MDGVAAETERANAGVGQKGQLQNCGVGRRLVGRGSLSLDGVPGGNGSIQFTDIEGTSVRRKLEMRDRRAAQANIVKLLAVGCVMETQGRLPIGDHERLTIGG